MGSHSRNVCGISSLQNDLLQRLHLAEKAGRKNRQSHDLDQADVLFLDVVQLLMRMEDSKRILLRGPVVPKDQIQLKLVAAHSGNRRDGVVRCSFCFCQDFRLRIAVCSPCLKNTVCQCNQSLRILAVKADNRHRPVHNAGLHILKAI